MVRGNAAEVATLAGREAEIRAWSDERVLGSVPGRARPAVGCVVSVTGPRIMSRTGRRVIAVQKGTSSSET